MGRSGATGRGSAGRSDGRGADLIAARISRTTSAAGASAAGKGAGGCSTASESEAEADEGEEGRRSHLKCNKCGASAVQVQCKCESAVRKCT